MTERAPLAAEEFTLQQLAEAAFVARGITTGLWRLAFNMTFAAISTQWEKPGQAEGEVLPTGAIAVTGLALFPATSPGPLVFDAATVHAARTKVRSGHKRFVPKRA